MRADWTRPERRISAYLARFGRYGIPFNAVYGPGAPAGIALSEILTADQVWQRWRRRRKAARARGDRRRGRYGRRASRHDRKTQKRERR